MRRTLGTVAALAAVTLIGWAPAQGSSTGTIKGTPYDDYLEGTAGKDRIVAGDGNDYLHGYAGNDHLMGGKGWDRLWGGPGGDRAYDGPGSSVVELGTGNDRATLGADDAFDRVDCGPGQDVIRLLEVGDQDDAFPHCEHVVDWSGVQD